MEGEKFCGKRGSDKKFNQKKQKNPKILQKTTKNAEAELICRSFIFDVETNIFFRNLSLRVEIFYPHFSI
jgi:hypothetical protein